MGQGLNTVGVGGLHLIHQAQDAVEGLAVAIEIGCIDLQACQMRDLFHVGSVE